MQIQAGFGAVVACGKKIRAELFDVAQVGDPFARNAGRDFKVDDIFFRHAAVHQKFFRAVNVAHIVHPTADEPDEIF